jgi:hypothetical protein
MGRLGLLGRRGLWVRCGEMRCQAMGPGRLLGEQGIRSGTRVGVSILGRSFRIMRLRHTPVGTEVGGGGRRWDGAVLGVSLSLLSVFFFVH